jgi:hypothetical protein
MQARVLLVEEIRGRGNLPFGRRPGSPYIVAEASYMQKSRVLLVESPSLDLIIDETYLD